MEHRETKRMIPGADTAVLLIHGIAGTPNHFRYLLPIEAWIPENWSVHNLLLDGHGMKADDFSRTSMRRWKSQVWEAFHQLCGSHRHVILVGHSMGTLFAAQLAVEKPEKVPFLFLVASPVQVGLRLFGVRNLLRLTLGHLDRNDPVQAATEKACGVATTKKLWKYLGWIPRLLELLGEIGRTRGQLAKLEVPCVAFQSERDELVSNRSRRILERSGRVEVHNLPRSTHFYYHPEDIPGVESCFAKLCRQHDL